MAKPDCPSCGSSQVVPILRGVHATRTIRLGNADGLALGAVWDAFDDWVCGDCGHRWPHSDPARTLLRGKARLVPFPGPRSRVDADGSSAEDLGDELDEDPLGDGLADEDPLGDGLADEDPLQDELADEGPLGDELAVGPVELTGVPGILREARERRGESLEQVAGATNIWVRYLRALEEDAPLDAFPGSAYAGFFLREYAQYLGLDPEPLLRAHRRRHAAEETSTEAPVEPLPDPRRRTRLMGRALGVSSALLLVAVMLVPQFVHGGRSEPASSSAGLGGSRAKATRVEPGRPPADLSTVHRARRLTVVIRPNAPCWVQAVVDGHVALTRTLAPRERTRLDGRSSIGLALGNAGGVTVTVNGEPVRTGASGQVVHLVFGLRDGAVRTLRG